LANTAAIERILFRRRFEPVDTVRACGLTSFVTYHVSKLSLVANSGSTRFCYGQNLLGIVQARPALGVGVGLHTAPLMFVTIVAESGMLGLITFQGFCQHDIRANGGSDSFEPGWESTVGISLLTGGITLVTTQLFTQPIGSLQQPWFWVALAMPLACVDTSE